MDNTQTISYTDSTSLQHLENLQKEPIDLYLTDCGHLLESSCRYCSNKRESHFLHIILNGKGTLELDGKLYYPKQGDAFLIPAGVAAWHEADEKMPWDYCWIGFSGIIAEKCMERAGFSRMSPVRQIGCTTELDKQIRRILKAHHSSICDDIRRNGLLLMMLSTLIEDYFQNDNIKKLEDKQNHSASVYVKQAVNYLTYHYGDQIRIGELANMIGVNRCYLSNNFKKLMGVPPQKYLMDLRIEKAKMLLQRTNMPVSSVANMVGYNDPLAFSKIFARYCGMSPRQYKEGGKQKN